MQIVIDIREDAYKMIKDGNNIPSNLRDIITSHLFYRIKNGTPLPKGHGKIIDVTFALEAKITKDNNGVSERTKGWNEACQAIYECAPTIIEADKEK